MMLSKTEQKKCCVTNGRKSSCNYDCVTQFMDSSTSNFNNFGINLILTLFYFGGNNLDVPDPPERPLIVSFTSRYVNLSWAHSQDPRNAPVVDYIIQIR